MRRHRPESGRCDPPDDGDCENRRADPVHVGTGAFVTEEREDVHFAGSRFPMRFARHFTSLDRWRTLGEMSLNRLAQGWFHTYDQRLFGLAGSTPTVLAPPTSGGSVLTVIHRTPGGVGQHFACAAPHDPA